MADETLNIIIKQSSKGDGAQKAAQGLGGIDKAIQVAITAFAALKGAQAAVDFIEFGAGVERQTAALDGLAKSAGTSGDAIVKAIQGASDFTIDRMTAMSAASKAMILDVAETPEQFERLTKVATSLGRAMGQDAAKSIDDFVVAAGRQSRMIADNLGLMVSAGTAQERYAQKLGKTVGELTDAENKQAFLNEMLVQGEAKMAALSGATGDAATKLEQFNALAKDVKAAVAEELAVSVVDLAGDTATLVANLRDFIDTAGTVTRFVVDATDAVAGWSSVMKVGNFLLEQSKMPAEHYAIALERGAAMNRMMAEAAATAERETRKQQMAQARIPIVVRDTVDSYDEYQMRLGRMPRDQEAVTEAILEANRAFEEQDRALKEQAEQALRTQEAILGFSMSMKSHFEQAAQNAEEYTQRREEIEQEHQDTLAELAKRGQSRLITIDVEAEEAKLEELKYRLDQAILKREEASDKAAQSAINAKDHAIQVAQEEYNKQTQLLDDYYNGRLIAHGENVSGLLTQENERYAEEMRLLEENRAAQEEAMNQSFGRMLLQQFDAWAQMSGISSEKAMEMRLAIAEEYGLIDEKSRESAEIWVGQWERFKDSAKLSADDVVGAAQRIKNAVESIPTERTVKIRIQTSGETAYQVGASIREQSGGYVMARQVALVGEEGPELAVFPPGTRIYNAGDTSQMIQRAAGYGGDFRSSRGTVSLPGPLRPAPDTYGGGLGLGGGTVVQNTWYQTFVIKGDQDAALLAQEIKRLERMEGDRPEMGRMF